MVIGDLNDFEDGAALTQNLVAPGVTLKNLWSEAPADNRYSFQFDGQLQTLDHIFVTDGLHAGVRDVRYVHFDNDYFERDETRHAAGVSDHDPPLVTIALPRRSPPRAVGEGSRPTAHRGEAAPGSARPSRSSPRGRATPNCADLWAPGPKPSTVLDKCRPATPTQHATPGRPGRAPRGLLSLDEAVSARSAANAADGP